MGEAPRRRLFVRSDNCAAYKKILVFFGQTLANAITRNDSMPADGLLKVVKDDEMIEEEILYRKK